MRVGLAIIPLSHIIGYVLRSSTTTIEMTVITLFVGSAAAALFAGGYYLLVLRREWPTVISVVHELAEQPTTTTIIHRELVLRERKTLYAAFLNNSNDCFDRMLAGKCTIDREANQKGRQLEITDRIHSIPKQPGPRFLASVVTDV